MGQGGGVAMAVRTASAGEGAGESPAAPAAALYGGYTSGLFMLAATERNVSVARHHVSRLLARAPDGTRETAALAVTELITNAVRISARWAEKTNRPVPAVGYCVSALHGHITVEVQDGVPWPVTLNPRPRVAADGLSGRGLPMLNQLCYRLYAYTRTPGKVVGVELVIP